MLSQFPDFREFLFLRLWQELALRARLHLAFPICLSVPIVASLSDFPNPFMNWTWFLNALFHFCKCETLPSPGVTNNLSAYEQMMLGHLLATQRGNHTSSKILPCVVPLNWHSYLSIWLLGFYLFYFETDTQYSLIFAYPPASASWELGCHLSLPRTSVCHHDQQSWDSLSKALFPHPLILKQISWMTHIY